jgi:hypothetical protein
MSFEFNPADEDPHGECRHEIHTLQAELENLRGADAMLRAIENIIPRNDAHRDYAETVQLFVEAALHSHKRRDIITVARHALNSAHADIGAWCQLADRQRQEMPNASHNPIAPTDAGIASSRKVQQLIGDVIGMIRDSEAQP